jgi:GNAT superfamily N-acetyltransferase
MSTLSGIQLRWATEADVPLILELIRALAEYEKLSDEVSATEELLRRHLFGAQRFAEARLACTDRRPVGFALFFHNFSTFLGRPGIYLEDIFVLPEFRGAGIGRALLRDLARIAIERDCARLEWAVLDWNEPALRFYDELGAKPMSQWRLHRMTRPAIEKLATTGER